MKNDDHFGGNIGQALFEIMITALPKGQHKKKHLKKVLVLKIYIFFLIKKVFQLAEQKVY